MTTGREKAAGEETVREEAARPAAKRAMLGRLSWGLADQAASSMTNFAVGIYVARSLGLAAFGVFSLAWVTYGVVLSVSRGLATDPLVVRFSGVPDASWRGAVARSSGAALGVGGVIGAACLVAGLALGGSVGPAFAALGVMLPGLLLQDAWRYSFFAAGNGRKAFVNDLVWGAALVPAMVIAARVDTVAAFVLAWGASAAVAALYGCLQSRVRPRPTGAREWLRAHHDLGYRYVAENVSTSGASQLRAYGLGAIVGVGAVGAIRGAELLLGPFLAVLMGLSLVTVARRHVYCGRPRTASVCSASSWAARRPSPHCSGARRSSSYRTGRARSCSATSGAPPPNSSSRPRSASRARASAPAPRPGCARSPRPAAACAPAVRLRLLRRRRPRRARPWPARSAPPGVSPPRPSAPRPCGGCTCGPPCASTTRTPFPK